MKYEWDNIAWQDTRNGEQYADVMLMPDDTLIVESGWEIHGPMRVEFTWNKSKKHTRVKYNALPSSVFNLDDAKEYPCKSCGAMRGKECIGSKPECAFRVFFIKGGQL